MVSAVEISLNSRLSGIISILKIGTMIIKRF
jgi:hypothetical protein